MSAGPALEMWSRQTGTAESDGPTSTVTMQRAFTVLLDAGDPLETVYNSAGLPLVGDLYPGSFAVFCTKLAPQRVSPIMAIVSADYKGEVGPGGSVTSSPISGDPVLQWGCSITDAAIDEDFDGNPIVTGADEPIEGLTERIVDDVCTIERNFLSINRYALQAYRRATNSDTFLGWPPGTARIMDDQATAVFSPTGTVAYWRVRASIQFRIPYRTTAAKAWYKRVRHEGFKCRAAAGGQPFHAFELVTKTPVTKPVALHADGTRIEDPDNEGWEWLEFKTLGSLPFGALGLV